MDNFELQQTLRKQLAEEFQVFNEGKRDCGKYFYELLQVRVNRFHGQTLQQYSTTRKEIELFLPQTIQTLCAHFGTSTRVAPEIVDNVAFTHVLKHSLLGKVLKLDNLDRVLFQLNSFRIGVGSVFVTIDTPVQTFILLRELVHLIQEHQLQNPAQTTSSHILVNTVEVDGRSYSHVIDTATNFLQLRDASGQLLMFTNNLMQVYKVVGATNKLLGVWKLVEGRWVFHFQESTKMFDGVILSPDSRMQSEFMLTSVLLKNNLIG